MITVIAEDEPLARTRLQRFLSKVKSIEKVLIATDGQEAISLITTHKPDLVILDINMPLKSGIEVAQEVQDSKLRPPAIIFTTAYEEFALSAFKVNAEAYLMKPIQESELLGAIQRVGELNRVQANEASSVSQISLMLKDSAKIESMKVSDIAYFRATDKLVLAGLLTGEESIVNLSLKQLEEKLAPIFFRIHRHTLINTHFMQSVEKDVGQIGYVVFLNKVDKTFPVSRRQVAALKKYFEQMCS